MKKLPYIFIFDIDNTIIGDLYLTMNEYLIYKIVKNNCNDFDITEELSKGVLRPYFKDFIEFIFNKYKNVELYVYSNASYFWINECLIKNIEKIIKIRFNKPYFTRENTNNKVKLLGNIFDIIMNDLILRYPLLKKDENKKYVFDNQLIFIDDIPNNLNDYPEKQIICPEYNYRNFYDIKTNLINKYNFNEHDFNNQKIIDLLDYKYNDYIYKLPMLKIQIIKDDKLIKLLLEMIQIRKNELFNIKSKNDIFFKDLIHIFSEFNSFDNNTIQLINKMIKF